MSKGRMDTYCPYIMSSLPPFFLPLLLSEVLIVPKYLPFYRLPPDNVVNVSQMHLSHRQKRLQNSL